MTASKENRWLELLSQGQAIAEEFGWPLTREEVRMIALVQQVVRYELERCGILPRKMVTALWSKDDSK